MDTVRKPIIILLAGLLFITSFITSLGFVPLIASAATSPELYHWGANVLKLD